MTLVQHVGNAVTRASPTISADHIAALVEAVGRIQQSLHSGMVESGMLPHPSNGRGVVAIRCWETPRGHTVRETQKQPASSTGHL